MDFLEFAITGELADWLASADEEAEALSQLKIEIDELRSEIEASGMKRRSEGG